MTSPVIWWVRRDLRLHDNPALSWALSLKIPIIPVFIWSPDEESPWSPGAASQWWLHYSLQKFDQELKSHNSQLVIRTGPSLKELEKIVTETKAQAVCWNRLYEPAIIQRDEKIKRTLRNLEIDVQSFNGALLIEPWQIQTKTGTPYKVFTPFSKSFPKYESLIVSTSIPKNLPSAPSLIKSISVDHLKLLPKIKWDKGFHDVWTPGEAAARSNFKKFIKSIAANYKEDRDIPSITGTSRMSPALHFGEVSPRWLVKETLEAMKQSSSQDRASLDWYLRELVWREFAHHILFHFPHTESKPLDEKFNHFPWKSNKEHLQRWQKGETGYPIVDAGMRELWTTGWMHNRVRMIVASFLTKDLVQHWKSGADWFWDTLVDASLANNTMGWQWASGCGADAAPYFRIFNPILQGEKFDPSGSYVRKWIPELKKVPDKLVHRPWDAGPNYCSQVVNHSKAREIALAAYQKMKDLR